MRNIFDRQQCSRGPMNYLDVPRNWLLKMLKTFEMNLGCIKSIPWFIESISWFIESIPWFRKSILWFKKSIPWFRKSIPWFTKSIYKITPKICFDKIPFKINVPWNFICYLWDIQWNQILSFRKFYDLKDSIIQKIPWSKRFHDLKDSMI